MELYASALAQWLGAGEQARANAALSGFGAEIVRFERQLRALYEDFGV